MLESMRTHAQSWIAKILLWGISLSFMLWGIGDYFMGSRVQSVATIDGEPIHEPEFAQAYERTTNQYRALFGKHYSKDLMRRLHVRENTLQTIINRRLILIEAHKLGLVTPDSAVLSEVEHNPAFSDGRAFDPARYRVVTRNMGYSSPEQYEAQLKVDLLASMLEDTLTESAPLTEAEIHAAFNHQFEKRVISAVIVDPASLDNKVHITDAEAHAYYDAHKNDYRSPLRLVMDAVDISPAHIAKGISIDAAELHKAYEKHKADYMQPEERRASHILIRISGTADKAARAAAHRKIAAIQAKLKAGADFATLARKDSEDKSTAAKGGDLGYFTKGTLAGTLDKAVFSLKLGQVSPIITTPYGYDLIKLTAIKPAGEKPFAEVKDQIKARLIQSRARDEAYQLSQDLDDALGKNPELKDAAASLNLPVRVIGPISARQAQADPLLGSDPDFLRQTLALKPGDPVNVVDLANGHYAAVEVMKRLQPAVMPYSAVKARVEADAEHAAAEKMAKALADKLMANTHGKSVNQIARASGQPKFLSKPVLSNGNGDDASWLNAAILNAAFSTPKGQWVDHVVEVPQGLALVRVDKVISPDAAEFTKQRQTVTRKLSQRLGAVRFARWLSSVRAEHKITINAKVLDRF